MSEKALKHGISARRYLIRTALADLGDATTHQDPSGYRRLFLQAYSQLHGYAKPALDAHPTVLEDLDELPTSWHRPDQRRWYGLEHYRWARVALWIEALYRDRVFGAKPLEGEIDPTRIVGPDKAQAAHYYAQLAYRRAIVDALLHRRKAIRQPDGSWANLLHDRTYNLVLSLAWPVLERLDSIKDRIKKRWTDHRPQTTDEARRLRRETVNDCIQAWHDAAMFSFPTTPLDEDADQDLLAYLQEAQEARP